MLSHTVNATGAEEGNASIETKQEVMFSLLFPSWCNAIGQKS